MTRRPRVGRGGLRRRLAGGAPRWRRPALPGHLRLLAADVGDPWLDAARRFLVSLELFATGELPSAGRGAHPLVALATYAAFVMLALAVIAAVTTVGRILEHLL